jgi:hypothetical protein
MEKVDYINTKREDLPKWLLQLWRINPELAEKAEIDYISLKKQLSIQGVVQAKTEKVCEHIFKKSYGRSGGEKCIKCGKRI